MTLKRPGSIALRLVFLLALLAVYTRIATDQISRYALYNADALYLPAFYQDLVSGVNVIGWRHPPAPYFFPDMLLYVPLNFLTGNVHLAIMLFGVIQIIGFLAGLLWLSHVLFGRDHAAQPLLVFVGAAFLLFLATGRCPAFVPILQSGHHFGVTFALGFLLTLIVHILHSTPRAAKFWGYIAILLVTSSLLMLSDAITFAQFLFPVLVSVWGLTALAVIPVKQATGVYLALMPVVPLAGHLRRIFLIFRGGGNPEASSEPVQSVLATMTAALNDLGRWDEHYWYAQDFRFLLHGLWLAFLLTAAGTLIYALRKARRHADIRGGHRFVTLAVLTANLASTAVLAGSDHGAWAVWLSFAATLALLWSVGKTTIALTAEAAKECGVLFVLGFLLLCPVLNILAALVIGGTTPRYFIPALLLPMFFGWPFVCGRFQRCAAIFRRSRTMLALTAVLVGAAYWLGIFPTIAQVGKLSNLTDFYPEAVACLDRETAARNIHNGLTQYWQAKYLTMLSKNHLHVVQTRHGSETVLVPDHVINNFNWYDRDFEFILTEEHRHDGRNLYAHDVIAAFGPPADTFTCDTRRVLVYNRPEDEDFQRQFRRYFFFESPAAELLSNTGDATGASRIAREGEHQAGALIFGPYLDLYIGNYAVDIYLAAQGASEEKDIGTWEVVTYDRQNFLAETATVLRRGKIVRNGEEVISTGFRLRRTAFLTHKVEIRVNYKGRGTLRVDRVVIRRTG